MPHERDPDQGSSLATHHSTDIAPRPALDVPAGELILAPGAPAEQWHATRAGGVCGSDLAAILGRSPFTTAARVYLDKVIGPRSLDTDKPFEDPIFWGRWLEDAVAAAWSSVTGIEVWKTGTYAHRDRPWQRANPDRLGDGFGLEVKTTDWRMAHHWDPDVTPGGVPFHVLCQISHYMAVTGLPFWWVVCLIGGNKLVVRRVEADPDDHATLCRVEDEFWHKHVMARRPPLVTVADAPHMNALHRMRRKDNPLELSDAIVRKLARHYAAKQQIESLSGEITALEVAIKDALGEHDIGRVHGRDAVTYRATKRIDKTGVPVRPFINKGFDGWPDYVGHDPDLDPPLPTTTTANGHKGH